VPVVFTENVVLSTIDGLSLSAVVSVPANPRGAMVMCHPHPLYGGDMDNLVVTTTCDHANEAGLAAVRFDFRGVRRSEGTHDDGNSERLDAAAALDEIAPFANDGPIVMAGYSFGSLVALNVIDPRLSGWIAVAPPIGRSTTVPAAAGDHRAKLLIGGAHDQFTTVQQWTDATITWRSTTLEVVPSADHFLSGHVRSVAQCAVEFVNDLVG
jgi:alpha/beta superfamily hydrolase